jgi:hypothetical protein
MASITSPEQGAQHECKRTFFCPSGVSRMGRSVMESLLRKSGHFDKPSAPGFCKVKFKSRHLSAGWIFSPEAISYPPMKYIFVTGGVVSSLGKGLAAASLGTLLELRGLKVVLQKLDPYLNVDPGTMNPFQHGEVQRFGRWRRDRSRLGTLRALHQLRPHPR